MNKQKLIKLRCKAWGITEDEYYCNQCSDFSLEDMARAYRRGKNKGKAETALLSQHILDLQKDKGNLTDKVKELKAQIEKMKSDVIRNVKWADQNKNEQMYCKLNAMFNQWEIKEND